MAKNWFLFIVIKLLDTRFTLSYKFVNWTRTSNDTKGKWKRPNRRSNVKFEIDYSFARLKI